MTKDLDELFNSNYKKNGPMHGHMKSALRMFTYVSHFLPERYETDI